MILSAYLDAIGYGLDNDPDNGPDNNPDDDSDDGSGSNPPSGHGQTGCDDTNGTTASDNRQGHASQANRKLVNQENTEKCQSDSIR